MAGAQSKKRRGADFRSSSDAASHKPRRLLPLACGRWRNGRNTTQRRQKERRATDGRREVSTVFFSFLLCGISKSCLLLLAPRWREQRVRVHPLRATTFAGQIARSALGLRAAPVAPLSHTPRVGRSLPPSSYNLHNKPKLLWSRRHTHVSCSIVIHTKQNPPELFASFSFA